MGSHNAKGVLVRVKLLAFACVVAATLGYAVADTLDVAPGVLTIAQLPPALASPLPSATPLAKVTDAPVPSPAGLEAKLGALLKDPRLGPSVAYSVRDGVTGKVLMSKDAKEPQTVASAQKLITALALSGPLNMDQAMTTRLMQGSDLSSVVLTAGGDTLLAPGKGNAQAVIGRAGVGDLVERAATTLKANNVTKISLLIDNRYANGPPIPASWDPRDVALGYANRITQLGLATNRPKDGVPARADPELDVAQAVKAAFAARGIEATVDANPAHRALGNASATELARVDSAPYRDVIGVALRDSDNALMENLARQAMVAALLNPNAMTTGAWVQESGQKFGLPAGSLSLKDASGLSSGQTVTVEAISQTLAYAADGTHPQVREALAGMPIAGYTGTLNHRFADARSQAARGIPRAKTGTLTGTSTISGTTVDAQGRPLLFVVVADEVPPSFFEGTVPAREALDDIVAALTSCGCS